MVADCAKAHGAPIRVGVNSGSIEKEILREEGGVTAQGHAAKALCATRRLLEDAGFRDIVLSLKATDVPLTVRAYELAAAETDYPLHVGVTEAGLPGEGQHQERGGHRQPAASRHRRHRARVADGRPGAGGVCRH